MYINSIINICTNDAFNYTSQMTPEFFPYKISHKPYKILILSLSMNNHTSTLQ